MLNFLKKLFSSEGKEKDPVCGMNVEPTSAKFKSRHQGKDYYFCSGHCQKQFEEKNYR